MHPDLELVQIRDDESFKIWSHGYPYRTVRWHFHPELHLVTETSGKYFVGDFIGDFEPGNLVLTGPNLPHNWLSQVEPGRLIERRCIVLQFTERVIEGAMAIFPELGCVRSLLNESRRGVLFTAPTSIAVRAILEELPSANGPRRIADFLKLLEILSSAPGRAVLASESYLPDPSSYMALGMNKVLTFIRENLSAELRETDVAEIAGRGPSAFSRCFRRHTGMSFVQYVNRLRINQACQLLTSELTSITDICFQVGFNNLSNFNRQFLVQKGMPPSKFRATYQLQAAQTAQNAA
jgi:AraC-like DNA-binding protein